MKNKILESSQAGRLHVVFGSERWQPWPAREALPIG
jgi:hypothetical protein